MSVGLVSHDLWSCPLELPEAEFSHARSPHLLNDDPLPLDTNSRVETGDIPISDSNGQNVKAWTTAYFLKYVYQFTQS